MDSRFCVVILAVASALLVANNNAQMPLMGGTYSHESIQRCQGMIQQIPNSFTFPGMGGGVGYGGMGSPYSGVGSPYYGGMGSPYYGGMGSPYYGMGVGGLRSSDGQEVNADPEATGEPGAPGAPTS